MLRRRPVRVLVLVLAVALVAGCGTTTQITEGNGESRRVVLSEDGRYVLFESDATDLVPGDTNGEPDLFTIDRETGTTTRITDGDRELPPDNYRFDADMSADGRYVAYHAFASDIVPGDDDDNGHADVFVWDRATGTTERITDGNEDSGRPALSADGRHVAFLSLASDLVPGDEPHIDIFSWDRATGETTRVTDDVHGHAEYPAISADGRHISFWVSGVQNDRYDIWSWDRTTGALTQVNVGGAAHSRSDISADGRYVVFATEAHDTGEEGQSEEENHGLYLWERTTGARTLLTQDIERHTQLVEASISDDGRRVAMPTRRGVRLWQRYLTELPGSGTPAISADGYDVATSRNDDIVVWSDRAQKPEAEDSPAPG